MRRLLIFDNKQDEKDSIRDLRVEAAKLAVDLWLHKDMIAPLDDILKDADKIYEFLIKDTKESL